MTDAEAMIQDCLKRYSKLNDWERGFIDGVSEMKGDDLTLTQYESLEKIWDRIT